MDSHLVLQSFRVDKNSEHVLILKHLVLAVRVVGLVYPHFPSHMV